MIRSGFPVIMSYRCDRRRRAGRGSGRCHDAGRPASGISPPLSSRSPLLLLSLITALPVDDVAQRAAVDMGAQVLAEQVDPGVTVFIAGARDVRRDQHFGI